MDGLISFGMQMQVSSLPISPQILLVSQSFQTCLHCELEQAAYTMCLTTSHLVMHIRGEKIIMSLRFVKSRSCGLSNLYAGASTSEAV